MDQELQRGQEPHCKLILYKLLFKDIATLYHVGDLSAISQHI